MGHFRSGQKIILFCSLLYAAVLHAQQPKPIYTEQQKTEHLLAYVASLQHAVFIRNGSEHPAKDAAAHLQMKRKRAGSRLKTTEDFIVRIASRSSVSGDPYLIRFENGKTFSAEMVLRLELKKLNEGRASLLQYSSE